MEQIRCYGDERTLAWCAFCGGETTTSDHCPSRVFLDEPYPANLQVVPACFTCNTGFSADEEYFACFMSCVIAGTTKPEAMPREKTKRILQAKPLLRHRIEQARSELNGKTVFKPEHERVSAIITKLAQGHALYELHESCVRPPDRLVFMPLSNMSHAEQVAFENPEPSGVWPEMGSRAMLRLINEPDAPYDWLNVQPGRYRFLASVGSNVDVRIVIHEYLSCHVQWD